MELLKVRSLEEAMERLYPGKFFIDLKPLEQAKVVNMARAIEIMTPNKSLLISGEV